MKKAVILLLFMSAISALNAQEIVQWGFPGTVPVMKDYDGDGVLDFAVYYDQTGTWYILGSTDGFIQVSWGFPGTIPVPADYDGDGKADTAVYCDQTGTWYVYGSTVGFNKYNWGFPNAIPIPDDYDNDGTTDLGVYYPDNGTWYLTTCIPAPTPPVSRKWTVLFYCDGDNNLEQDFLDKFIKIAKVGSDDNINILVQLDRIPGGATNYGDWVICERFYVTQGMEPTQDNAVSDWGDGTGGREVDMSDPDTLKNFINWGTASYPADNYALVVGNHGFGWKGMCLDETTADSFLLIKELKQALTNAVTDMDLIALDACLIQMIEVAYEIRDAGPDFMIGSETYGQSDWPYDILLSNLASNAVWSAGQFAANINEMLYDYFCVQKQTPGLTMSTLDLSEIETLAKTVKTFADSMINTNSSLATIQAAAQDVMTQHTKTVIDNRHGTNWNDIAYGMTIYFPVSTSGYAPDSFFYYTPKLSSFAGATSWRYFLNYFFDPLLHPMEHKIYDARNALTALESEDENIDLYDFCDQIVNH